MLLGLECIQCDFNCAIGMLPNADHVARGGRAVIGCKSQAAWEAEIREGLLATGIPAHHVEVLIASRFPLTLDMLIWECRNRGIEVTGTDVAAWREDVFDDPVSEPARWVYGPADMDELLEYVTVRRWSRRGDS